MIFEIGYASDKHIGEKKPCEYAFKNDGNEHWLVDIKTIEDFAKLSKDVVKNANKSWVGYYENNNGNRFAHDEINDVWSDEENDFYYPTDYETYENCDENTLLISDLHFVYTRSFLTMRINNGPIPSITIIDDYMREGVIFDDRH